MVVPPSISLDSAAPRAAHHPAADHAEAAPPLRLVFWETTTGCNLACIHCRRLEVSRELSRQDLNTEQSLAFIRSLPQTGRPILVFSGGEPLMRPDVWELALEAKRIGLPTALATNGTIMNAEVAQRVRDVGFRRVSISFDGPDAPTHDQFRGDGAFDASIRGFKELRAVGMSMQINTTVARHNYRKLDEAYRLALDLGADALHIFMLVPVGCGMELSPEIMLDEQEYEQALNWIYDRSLEGKIHLKATCAPHYFRVMRQRAKADGRPMPAAAHPHRNTSAPAAPTPAPAAAAAPHERHLPTAALPAHEPTAPAGTLPHASPTIRKLARELGVPLDEVNGSGPKGRITQEDVQEFVKAVLAGTAQTKAQAAKSPAGAPAGRGRRCGCSGPSRRAPARSAPPRSRAASRGRAPSAAPARPAGCPSGRTAPRPARPGGTVWPPP
jgi:MoaA/NifB/PqqE/SkfB family radical SAM enzyme